MLMKKLGIEAIEEGYLSYLYFKIPSILIIPDGCRKIGECAFDCSEIKKVVIPGSVESIGCEAFCNCAWLEEVEILEGVKNIEGSAFSGCVRLEKVKIPESVEWIREAAFSDCNRAVVTVKRLSYLNYWALWGCRSVEYVKEEVRD